MALIKWLFLFIALSIYRTDSQCSSLTSSTCESDGYCVWDGTDCVCGAISWDQDIAFIFDSSMTSLQWTYATQFAADLLKYGSPSDSTTRAAIFATADQSDSISATLSFGDEDITTTIDSTLPSLSQSFQSDLYLKNALEGASNLFNASSSTTTRKVLIIFATQEHVDSPCQLNMRSQGTLLKCINGYGVFPVVHILISTILYTQNRSRLMGKMCVILINYRNCNLFHCDRKWLEQISVDLYGIIGE